MRLARRGQRHARYWRPAQNRSRYGCTAVGCCGDAPYEYPIRRVSTVFTWALSRREAIGHPHRAPSCARHQYRSLFCARRPYRSHFCAKTRRERFCTAGPLRAAPLAPCQLWTRSSAEPHPPRCPSRASPGRPLVMCPTPRMTAAPAPYERWGAAFSRCAPKRSKHLECQTYSSSPFVSITCLYQLKDFFL